jgi:hypothetical protein
VDEARTILEQSMTVLLYRDCNTLNRVRARSSVCFERRAAVVADLLMVSVL